MIRFAIFLPLFGAISAAQAATPAPVATPKPTTAKTPRARFHLVSDKLVRKISPGAQRTERAVVAFPRASGFVVAADAKRPQRVLILTNFHVAGKGPPAGAIAFRDRTSATALRTVAANKNLDYAVIEAELVDGPRATGVEPLALERDAAPMKPGQEIYSVGGHTGLDTFDPQRKSIAGGAAVETSITEALKSSTKEAPVGFRTIALGKVNETSTKPKVILASGNHTLGIGAEMPNAAGMSGSPVLSRDTHRVVGLHFSGLGAGSPSWVQSSVPVDLILRDLRHGLARGRVDAGARDLVQQLVDGK